MKKCCNLCKYMKTCTIVKHIIESDSILKKTTDFSKLYCNNFVRLQRIGRKYAKRKKRS